MKSLKILLICWGLLSVAACKKEPRAVDNFAIVPAFQIAGIKDVVLERTPFVNFFQTTLPLRIGYGNGVVKRLYLTVISPDSGIKAQLSVPSGYPDFQTVLSFQDKGAPNGIYAFKLRAHFEGEAVQEFPFNLTLKGSRNCSDFFDGRTYQASTECKPGQVAEAYSVVLRGPQYDSLLFINFDGSNDTVFTFIDQKCSGASYSDYIRGDYRYQVDVRITPAPSNGPPITVILNVDKISYTNPSSCNYRLLSQ